MLPRAFHLVLSAAIVSQSHHQNGFYKSAGGPSLLHRQGMEAQSVRGYAPGQGQDCKPGLDIPGQDTAVSLIGWGNWR